MGSSTRYAKEMENIKNDYEQLKNNLQELLKTVGDKNDELTKLLMKEKSDIDDLKKERDAIDEYYKEIFDENDGIKVEIDNIRNEISESKKSFNNLVDSIRNLMNEFEAKCDTSDKKLVEFDNKYKDYVIKIESLLPGATAAGLAEAYDKVIDGQKKSRRNWTIIFSLSMVGIFALLCLLLTKGIVTFQTSDSVTDTLIKLIRIASMEFPLIWLAIVSSRKINQFMVLIEEYRHKWATMRVYDGMNSAVKNMNVKEEEDNREVQLFDQLLNTVGRNPTEMIKDVKSDDMFEKIKDMASTLKNTKNKE